MLARLEAGIERERRFVAEASHELRTPLSLLKTELELALRRPRSADELRAALSSAAEETDRLVLLADDLLVLARSDEGELRLVTEPVPVRDLLETVERRFGVRAGQAGRGLRGRGAGRARRRRRPAAAGAGARQPRRQRPPLRRRGRPAGGRARQRLGGAARERRRHRLPDRLPAAAPSSASHGRTTRASAARLASGSRSSTRSRAPTAAGRPRRIGRAVGRSSRSCCRGSDPRDAYPQRIHSDRPAVLRRFTGNRGTVRP